MEVDGGLKMVRVAEPICSLLDRLYLRIDAFADSIRNAMVEVRQDVGDVPFQ